MNKSKTKPIEYENLRIDLEINNIMNKMFANSRRTVHNHIKKFLAAGGELKSLTLSQHEDGKIILRADERTVVTLQIQIVGRKINNIKFKAV
jgi:hypothetical protein